MPNSSLTFWIWSPHYTSDVNVTTRTHAFVIIGFTPCILLVCPSYLLFLFLSVQVKLYRVVTNDDG